MVVHKCLSRFTDVSFQRCEFSPGTSQLLFACLPPSVKSLTIVYLRGTFRDTALFREVNPANRLTELCVADTLVDKKSGEAMCTVLARDCRHLETVTLSLCGTTNFLCLVPICEANPNLTKVFLSPERPCASISWLSTLVRKAPNLQLIKMRIADTVTEAELEHTKRMCYGYGTAIKLRSAKFGPQYWTNLGHKEFLSIFALMGGDRDSIFFPVPRELWRMVAEFLF